MAKKTMLISALILVFCLGFYSREIGEDCTVRKTGRRGICTTIYSCEDAMSDLRAKRRPNYCTPKNSILGVCCPITEVNKFKRISEQKCAEYSPAANSACKRSIQPSRLRETAELNEFTHTVVIGYDLDYRENFTAWNCSGSLISDLFALTAAHCNESKFSVLSGQAKYVRLGPIDRAFKGSELYNIKRFIVHPGYEPPSFYNDIALIELDREVKFELNIRPACLPKYVSEPVENLIFTGLKITKILPMQNRLQKTALEKFSNEECNEEYMDESGLPNGINATTQFCAGSHTDGRGPCFWDAGGPLLIYHYSRYCVYTVVGIASYGKVCRRTGVPYVFTQVGAYLSWIEDEVWGGH